MYNLFKTYRSDGDIPGIFNEMKYSHADANVKNNGIQNIEAMVKMLPSSVLILKIDQTRVGFLLTWSWTSSQKSLKVHVHATAARIVEFSWCKTDMVDI